MKIFRAMDASASALTAGRLQMDLIAHNLANMNTTRTAAGTPYRRRMLVQEERVPTFQDALDRAGNGVRVTQVVEDQSPFQLKYDPSHPDADAQGMVRMPNVDMLQEITDMMMATRYYEANLSVFNASKGMALKAIEIGRG